MDLDLTNKNALVCGASKGIGAATAKSLAALGAHVILLARNEDKLKNLCDEIGNAEYIATDISDHEKMLGQVSSCLSKLDSIEILINNAGGPAPGLIKDAQVEQVESALNTHLFAFMRVTELLLPAMQNKEYGRIINIMSTSVKVPLPNLGVSNTTRWAVAAWAKTLAAEVAPFGITVNNVLPGYIDTDRIANLMAKTAERENKPIAQVREEIMNTIPCRRFGKPEEMADFIAYLASPAASYINGVAVPIDGGRTPCL